MRLLAGLLDRNSLPIRVNQPAQLDAVGDPTLHLLAGFRGAVRWGEQLDDEGGAKPREPCELLSRHTLQLLGKEITCIGTQHRSVGEKEASIVVEDAPLVVGMPPTTKLVNNLGIAIAGQHTCGRVHADRSFARAFVLNIVVFQAHRLELRVRQRRFDGQAAGQRECFKTRERTHSSILPPISAGTMIELAKKSQRIEITSLDLQTCETDRPLTPAVSRS